MSRATLFVISGALVLSTLAGCERAQNVFGPAGFEYQGTSFKGRIDRDRDAREKFTVNVRGADRGLPGALEAARLAANRYCSEQFGSSDITWAGATPDDDPSSVMLDAGGNLSLSGVCDTW